MIQLQRIILVWVTLMIITNILVEAQGIIKQPTAKSSTIPFPTITTKQPDPSPTTKQPDPSPTTKQPDPSPTTKKPDPPPPVTPPPSLTKQPDPPPTIPPPPPKQQPLPPTTDPLPPPISTKQPDPLPSIPAYTTSNPVSSNPATLPNPISTDSPASTSNIPCTISKVCPDQKMFCNLPLGICQFKGRLDNKCNNDNECQQNLICNRNVCQFRDSETDNQKHYNVKKAAIIGGSVIGFFSISGLIFAAYRHFKTSKSRKVSIPSTIYSTTDDDTIYPFSERSNSFSDSAPPPRVPITRAPTTNRYDPPGRPRQGFYNNYNNNEGGYMRQNEQGVTRTMNLIQQTRGNFIPPTQPNYNWNYGVPPMMNQGLFPIPTVGNYGGPIPNNMKNFGGDNINNLPGEDKLNRNNYPTKILTNKVSLPELYFDDKQKGSQTLGDNQEKESVYDFYARPPRPPRPPNSSE